MNDPKAIVISASSDIGTAAAKHWRNRGWAVSGTYRTPSQSVEELKSLGIAMTSCDLIDVTSVESACSKLEQTAGEWDVLAVCPGLLEPIGQFDEVPFDAWEESVDVNLLRPIRMVRRLLASRRRGAKPPIVIFFSGGGVNDAPTRYSAYTLAKVALVKMCELLDAEIPDTRFVILGTGWVNTKIHEATLRAGAAAGTNLQRTIDKLEGQSCTSIERILECCDWAIDAPREVVSGRNFSVPNDAWGTSALSQKAAGDHDFYKLRRSGNQWSPSVPTNDDLNLMLAELPALYAQHGPDSPTYRYLKKAARNHIQNMFSSATPSTWQFGDIGELCLPYFKMGAVDSLNLFDIDELILFSFYWRHRKRYRRVADIGANIGLHTIILSKCGFEVKCFEPDPVHFERLKYNLSLNHCERVSPHNAAVSSKEGTLEFVRVLGNTTGSHLAGSKPSPYGELERFPVKVAALRPLLGWADLVKMDVEGHETEILLSTTPADWAKTDAMLEVGSPAAAKAIFERFWKSPVQLYAQKSGWGVVDNLTAMPTTYKDGSLFLTSRGESPWQ